MFKSRKQKDDEQQEEKSMYGPYTPWQMPTLMPWMMPSQHSGEQPNQLKQLKAFYKFMKAQQEGNKDKKDDKKKATFKECFETGCMMFLIGTITGPLWFAAAVLSFRLAT